MVFLNGYIYSMVKVRASSSSTPLPPTHRTPRHDLFYIRVADLHPTQPPPPLSLLFHTPRQSKSPYLLMETEQTSDEVADAIWWGGFLYFVTFCISLFFIFAPETGGKLVTGCKAITMGVLAYFTTACVDLVMAVVRR